MERAPGTGGAGSAGGAHGIAGIAGIAGMVQWSNGPMVRNFDCTTLGSVRRLKALKTSQFQAEGEPQW